MLMFWQGVEKGLELTMKDLLDAFPDSVAESSEVSNLINIGDVFHRFFDFHERF